MKPSITETLEQSKYLLGLVLKQGHAAFFEAWHSYSDMFLENYGNEPQEIDRRLLTLASGFM